MYEALGKVNRDFQNHLVGFREAARIGIRNAILSKSEIRAITESLCEDGLHCPPRTFAAGGGGLSHYRPFWEPVGVEFGRNQQGVSSIGGAGWAFSQAVIVKVACTLSGIRVFHGAIAGNERAGLYDNGAGNQPDGADLLAESASIAAVNANGAADLAFPANIQVPPGIYWPAIQSNDALCEYAWNGRGAQEVAGTMFNWSRGINVGAYLAFPNPCPVTAADANAYTLYLIVASIP